MRNFFCDRPAAQALGWPKNIGHATSPHQAMMARFAQRNAEVLALSATGLSLDADLVVTEGHRHNTLSTLLSWRQLAAWPIVGRGTVGQITVGQAITSTLDRDLGLYFFRMPLDAGGVRVTDIFYPRVRVTVPVAGAPAGSQMIVSGDLVRVVAFGFYAVVATLPPINVFAQAAPPVVSFVNQWLSFGGIEIPPSVLDARFALRLRAHIVTAGDQGQVFEAAVGLRDGL